ncbi:hypothetical protein [Sneathiella sp.]|uniref:hypothetical protein n=1 Tax=Sneathiella sp. TaxID=1964365 RepID=UPI003564D8CD
MWDHQLSYPRMRSIVEKAAQLTVVESRRGNMRFERWNAPDRLRGLNGERRKRAVEASGTSNTETASDGVTAEAGEQPLSHAVSATDKAGEEA